MTLFALYDKKSLEYSCVSAERNLAMFERSLSVHVNTPRPNNLLYTNSADFDIYRIGQFDPKTGVVKPDFEFIKNCSALKEES